MLSETIVLICGLPLMIVGMVIALLVSRHYHRKMIVVPRVIMVLIPTGLLIILLLIVLFSSSGSRWELLWGGISIIALIGIITFVWATTLNYALKRKGYKNKMDGSE